MEMLFPHYLVASGSRYVSRESKQILICSLPAYNLGDFHWALCHFFAFAGTFFALLLVSAYNYEGAITGDQEGEGIKIWTVCILTLLIFEKALVWSMHGQLD